MILSSGGNIFLAENDPTWTERFKTIIERAGYTVALTADTHAASIAAIPLFDEKDIICVAHGGSLGGRIDPKDEHYDARMFLEVLQQKGINVATVAVSAEDLIDHGMLFDAQARKGNQDKLPAAIEKALSASRERQSKKLER